MLLTQYCSGDKIEKNEMGGACSTYGEEERVARMRKRRVYAGFW